MIVDVDYYNIWTEGSDDTENGYVISKSLKTLYDSQESSLNFGNKMNTSNVYGYIDENSVLTQISTGSFGTNIITNPSTYYRANLRLFWSVTSSQTVESKTGFDIISDSANTHFIQADYNTRGTNANSAYYLSSFVRLRYDQLCLFVRFRITNLNRQSGGFSTSVMTLEEINNTYSYAEELLDVGLVITSGQLVFISGVVLTSSIKTDNADPSTFRYIYPLIEFNYNGNVYFGKPFENELDRGIDGYYFNNFLTYYGNGVYVSSNGNLPSANDNYTLTEFCYGDDFCFGFSGTNNFEYNTLDYLEFEVLDHMIVLKYPRDNYYSIGKFFTFDECMNMVASLGLYFTFNRLSAQTSLLGQNLTDTNIYLGKMYEDGRCDGTYTQGLETLSEPQAQNGVYIVTNRIGDTTLNIEPVDTDEPFVPESDEDPDSDTQVHPALVEGVEFTLQKNRRLASATNFITLYNITPEQLEVLGGVLWNSIASYDPSNPSNSALYNFYVQLGNDVTGTFDTSAILNYFISLRVYPFSVGTLPNLTTASGNELFIGNGRVGIPIQSTIRILTSTIGLLDAGDVLAQPITPYNDFRDYYNSTVTAFLPYCGTVELNPTEVLNKTLHCYYAIDFYTGECTAYITVEDTIEYIVGVSNGVIGVQIPLSASSQTQLNARHTMDYATNARLLSSTLFNIGGLINPIKEADYGAMFGEGGAFHNIANNLISVFETEALRQSRSGVSAPYLSGGNNGTSFFMPDSAYLQIRRGTYTRPKNYGHTVSYPNTTSGKLHSYSGFTICNNVDVSGLNCTAEEQNEIKRLLESGIYI